ncbi:MAG: 5'/3'-nucleotidase SurE [Prevotella sp.]
MDRKKPVILISNDDGYMAPGLQSLIRMLGTIGAKLLVCAPDGPRSGYSCAFSADRPLRLFKRSEMPDVEVWSCTGTPVDCVKLAIDRLLHGKMPDLVVGGINHGDNSTVNSHYSGTMGVAREGCMKYIPSIAFSSCYYNHDADLEPLGPYVRAIVNKVLAEGLPRGVCLNVNFPARQEFAGVKVCRMNFGQWVNEVVPGKHPAGYEYYWLVGSYRDDEPEARDTDQWALRNGYVAITPTRLDITAYEMMDELDSWFGK